VALGSGQRNTRDSAMGISSELSIELTTVTLFLRVLVLPNLRIMGFSPRELEGHSGWQKGVCGDEAPPASKKGRAAVVGSSRPRCWVGQARHASERLGGG
jgi:hypothetical protein